jgi:uncharacterized protein (TIGR03086 family)
MPDGWKQEVSVDADDLQRAVTSSRAVLASVRPEQMDDPTPCQSWKVRDLINHMIDAPSFAATVMENGRWITQGDEPVDHAAGDYMADYVAATSRAVASFRAEGAMSKTLNLPFGEMPAAAFLYIATGDAFVHGWDLARATGFSADFDPELAAELLEAIRPLLPDQMRGAEGTAPFGPEVSVAVETPAVDRLAAFLGRQP